MVRKMFLSLLLLLAVAFGKTAVAQVPTQIQYNLCLSDQKGKKVSVRMELRQGAMDGEIVWFQSVDTETDTNGNCTMTLDFGNSIDWGNSPYYIVAIVDDKEIGGSILTSVPYALRAATLDGFITKEELVGTWKGEEEDSDGDKYTITFNENGTGTLYQYRKSDGELRASSTISSWSLRNGILVRKEAYSEKDREDYPWYRTPMTPIQKISDTTICMAIEYLYDSMIFTKE